LSNIRTRVHLAVRVASVIGRTPCEISTNNSIEMKPFLLRRVLTGVLIILNILRLITLLTTWATLDISYMARTS
jgi:hypothetical protein